MVHVLDNGIVKILKKKNLIQLLPSFNRNFRGRNDGNSATLAFIGSPETVTAMVIAGSIDFNPATDKLINDKGEEVRLKIPLGVELPESFVASSSNFIPPKEGDTSDIEVVISPSSERLQLLEPFSNWNYQDSTGRLPVLLKAEGKCTTDHVSPAGKWLKLSWSFR